MADTGWRNPGTVVNDSAVGQGGWLNPDNAKISNDLRARTTALVSYYLKATNFGFSIPGGATINGIVVEIERKSRFANDVEDYKVQIVKATGVFGSQNKALPGFWSTTESYYAYGNSSDLWGESWTQANINHANFGVGLSVDVDPGGTANVDHIRIKVYYTEVVGINMKLKVSAWKDADALKIKASGAWKPGVKAWQAVGGEWKVIFG